MKKNGHIRKFSIILINLQIIALAVFSQQVYFIDGYHGGVYGHYPKQYTKFITESLDKNPQWKINLEIEPETWDSVRVNEPDNYNAFKNYFLDQSIGGRIEYINPSYGQGYLYNINGESIIRQFQYGIAKMHEHFPNAVFTTYSSEEPCFTSALPQLLTSFGFKYASLKNPNTCWGGYTRGFGGELVNWIGPDGTRLITVPRYGVEALHKNSTWQTLASDNSTKYLDAAFSDHIKHPIGMCLQDAGWKNGPWLGRQVPTYPTTYTTWRNYFQNIAVRKPDQDWKFSQEDLQVSLVWGAQVLQKIAKEVRVSENKIGNAEKLAVMAKLYAGSQFPKVGLDEAWRDILLSQHHDCWIVPYNGRRGDTWIDKVARWTGKADAISDSAILLSTSQLNGALSNSSATFVRVFNTSANERDDFVKVTLPNAANGSSIILTDDNNIVIPSQLVSGRKELLFKARVPAVGFTTYRLQTKKPSEITGNKILKQPDGTYRIETNLYNVVIDPLKGGTIKSLVVKALDNKEMVDSKSDRSFNELRGYFFRDSSYASSTQNPAIINIVEDGPLCSKLEINGTINKHPFTQTITLLKDEPLIDLKVNISWRGNPGIGNSYKQNGGYEAADYRKAFYEDRDKLLTLFPLNLTHQKIYKNAPFDVTESRLQNTFFNTWDSIKNNVILNWVDVAEDEGDYAVALFSNHTTSYSHGQDYPLGLTTQYSGVGLWGGNYALTGPTEISYALLPHKNKWDKAGIWTANTEWNNPMTCTVFQSTVNPDEQKRSLLSFSAKGLEITAITMEGSDLLVRLFNAEAEPGKQVLSFDGTAESVDLVELNGNKKQHLPVTKVKLKKPSVSLDIPRFGVRTILFKNFRADESAVLLSRK